MRAELAILNGRTGRAPAVWPTWPEVDDADAEIVSGAVRSGRWSVTVPSRDGSVSLERRAAQKFGRILGLDGCVSVDHGSSALRIALDALDVGEGAEVIVPAFTWVACATAVLSVGAVPVYADVNRNTGCISVESAERKITERTRVIMAVHVHGCTTDLDALRSLCERHGLLLLEDCSQAHGGMWKDRPLGSIGDAAAFSLQANKLLTCGEGGIVASRHPELLTTLEELRADSRRYSASVAPHQMELSSSADAAAGRNAVMSELQAALLLSQLDKFRGQQERRANAARWLAPRLRKFGFRTLVDTETDLQTAYYQYVVEALDHEGVPAWLIARALSAELDTPVSAIDAPLPAHELMEPWMRRHTHIDWPKASEFPGVEHIAENFVIFGHSVLLAGQESLQKIVDAVEAVVTNMSVLRAHRESLEAQWLPRWRSPARTQRDAPRREG